MQRETMQQDSPQFRAGERVEGQHASGPREKTPRTTSQAERAVMHPEDTDPEWRYYHGPWHC